MRPGSVKRSVLATIAVSFVLGSYLGCAGPGEGEGERLSFGDSGKADGQDSAALPECAQELSPIFVAAYEAVLPVLEENTVPARWLTSGRNYARPGVALGAQPIFETFADLIVEARHEVDVQTFSWHLDSDPAQLFLASLKELERRKRERGDEYPVVVRILLNTQWLGINGGESTLTTMKRLFAAIEELGLDPRYVRCELATHIHDFTGSFHGKSLVIDGVVGLLTGVNMNYWDNFDWGEHDAAFVLEGEVVRSLLAEFDDAWSRSKLWVCGRGPRPAPGGPHHKPNTSHPECFETPPPVTHTVAPLEEGDYGCRPAFIAGRHANSGYIGRDREVPQDQAFLAAMAAARQRIRIRTPNLNDDAAVEAILQAIKATPELEVQMVLAKNYENLAEQFDGGINSEIVAELYASLHDAGVKNPCQRLQIRWYSDLRDGKTAIDGNLDREAKVNHPSHIKYASYDGEVAIIGSANMDTQSWNRSREVNVVLDDPETVATWDAQLFGEEFTGAVIVEECAPPPN